MRFRAVLVLTALSLAAPATALGGGVGHVRVATFTNATFPSYSQSAQRNGAVILQAWQQDRLRALKVANPNVKVLVYKNLGFINEGTSFSGLSSSGVSYKEADTSHPEWFLRNTSGQRFTSNSYDYLWAADLGNAAYQDRWADGVLAELRADGWDGVFIDDANATMKYHYRPSDVAKYPTDAAYNAAVRSAVATIGPRVSAAGKLAVANIGSWGEYPSVGNDWLQFLDGAMDEMFLKWGTTSGQGYAGTSRWQAQLAELKLAESQGKLFLAISHSSATDDRAARYGYATMLLGSEGRGLFSLAADYANETWFPEYEYDLGAPTGPESGGADGVHRRQFERGLAVVNPTPESREVSFGGSYSGSGLTSASGATLPPFSGLVLTRDGAQVPPPPPVESQPIGVIGTVKTPGRVVLRWRGGAEGLKYRIKRNGRTVALLVRRVFVDRGARPGRSQRYRIVAVTRGGRVVRRSAVMRIRTPLRTRRSRVLPARSLVSAALPTRLGGWRRAYVERRVHRGHRTTWRRVSRSIRPRAAMRFRLRLRHPAAVRLVLESATGATVRSPAVRAGG